ncbi:phage holin family protein [Veillonella magna]|uniref:Phage holin family protein n=1 Tax=Veillonella magna TaxID=464322 RepID=A0ABS2GGM4_9FIRM|nr:phage holin family protein [Veillonella magna]MBM6913301.1 phage holin family protein [Veillonella magna]
MVSLCSILATEFNINAIYYVAVGGYISIEILLILENSGKAGIPIPAKLRDTLEQPAEEKIAKK